MLVLWNVFDTKCKRSLMKTTDLLESVVFISMIYIFVLVVLRYTVASK